MSWGDADALNFAEPREPTQSQCRNRLTVFERQQVAPAQIIAVIFLIKRAILLGHERHRS